MNNPLPKKYRPARRVAALACAALLGASAWVSIDAPALFALPSIKPPSAEKAADRATNTAVNAGEKAAKKETKQAIDSRDIDVSGVIEKGLDVAEIHIIPKKDYAEVRKLLQAISPKASQFESADKAHRKAVADAEKRKKDPPASDKLDKARENLAEALKKLTDHLEAQKFAKFPMTGAEAAPGKEADLSKARNIKGEAPKDGYLCYSWARRTEKTTKSSFGNRTEFTAHKGIALVRVAATVQLKGTGEPAVTWVDDFGTDEGGKPDSKEKPGQKEKGGTKRR